MPLLLGLQEKLSGVPKSKFANDSSLLLLWLLRSRKLGNSEQGGDAQISSSSEDVLNGSKLRLLVFVDSRGQVLGVDSWDKILQSWNPLSSWTVSFETNCFEGVRVNRRLTPSSGEPKYEEETTSEDKSFGILLRVFLSWNIIFGFKWAMSGSFSFACAMLKIQKEIQLKQP